MKKTLLKLLPFLFLAGLLLILFSKVFFLGQVFYEGDNFHLNIPAKYFLVQQISHGIFPFWNPYLFLGIPYFADFNVGVLNPLNFIYFLFPVPRALTLIVLLDLFLIGAFQYIFLRVLKLQKFPALLGGLVFALGGSTVALYGNMTYLNIIVYVPLVFLFAYLLTVKKQAKWLFALIALQTLQFISGHPQPTYYTMLFISIYLFFFSKFTWKNRVLLIAVYLLAPLLLSAVQLIPFVEYVFHATRPVGSIDYASWGNLPLGGLVMFFFPMLFGSHVDGNWWGPQWILGGYIGIPTLIFFYFGLFKTSFPLKKFTIAGILLSLLLAMGKLTPLFYIFYYFVPGWKFFRAPSGLVAFYGFFASILAAYGLQYLAKKKIKINKYWAFLLILSGITALISVLIIYITGQPSFWKNIVQTFVTKGHVHILSHLLLYSSEKIQAIFLIGFWNIFFSVGFLFVSILWLLFGKRKYLLIGFIFLTSLSLLIPDSKTVVTTTMQLYSSNIPVPNVLRDVQSGEFRALSLQINLHQKRENLPGREFFLREAEGNIGMYKDDNNIERGIYQARGYTSLTPASYGKFLNNTDTVNVTGVDVDHLSLKQLSSASIKYIISHEPLPQNTYNNIPLDPVATSSGKYYIYENVSAKPRAYLLSSGSANITFAAENQITVKTSAKKATSLILTDWYYPGWKAYINGKEVPIQVYETTFRQVSIPKGKAIVKFIYDPLSFKLGLVITIISLLSFVALFVFRKNKNIS